MATAIKQPRLTHKAMDTTAFIVTRQGVQLDGQPTIENFIHEFQRLRDAHDAVLWCLGDMVNIGRLYWPEEWVQAIDELDYAPGYLDNLARCCAAYEYEDRHHSRVIAGKEERVPITIYRLMSPTWIEHKDRQSILNLGSVDGWSRVQYENEKAWLWQQMYQDMPYKPHYTRRAKEAWIEWNENGGRERHAEIEARGPTMPRLKGCLTEVRAYVRRRAVLATTDEWDRVNRYLDQLAKILEELSP